ncbi:MAG: cupredoxin family protein [Betaproteobacteria bacterium]|nr:cupredoxin family protein [Betaproteobacteria bacterium]MDH3435890.1 cupredoxin family protein [Betaproteobacteria bacterium]
MTKGSIITAIVTAALLAPALALADAGHGAAIGKPGNPKKVTRTIKISGSDNMRYTPSAITVKRGETVRLVVRNTGKIDHELVIGTLKELKEHAELMRKHPGMEHDEPNMTLVRPGETREIIWQFTNAGTLDFACTIPGHLEAGMVGKIKVSGR